MVGTTSATNTPNEDGSGQESPNVAATQTLPVSLGDRSYDIQIGTDTTQTMIADIAAATKLSHAILFYDSQVHSIAQSLISDLAGNPSIRCDSMSIASGERSKSISQYGEMLEFCLRSGGDRQSVVIALGGGVVGDLAGFVAATYTRGVRLVQIPTTLLSMVDSSVGGKTGVNLPGGKNMVGAFWQPELVLIDSSHLHTLPERDFVSGIAEIIKYGVIEDAEFFEWLEQNIQPLRSRQHAAVRHAIAKSCQSKSAVVAADERETSGRRAILNYGHTFAHAIEATVGYGNVTHGEAVAIGMEMAMQLAVQRGTMTADDQSRQRDLIRAAGLPICCRDAGIRIDADAMIDAMSTDKKVAHGNLRFVLPTKIGHVELVGKIDPALVRTAIETID